MINTKEPKMEVLHTLESLNIDDGNLIPILNFLAPNYCSRRKKRLIYPDNSVDYSCKNCVTRNADSFSQLFSDSEIDNIITLFRDNFGTRILCILGRGDPFYPASLKQTLLKLSIANNLGMKSYLFTSGDNLTHDIIKTLSSMDVNIIISLYGNPFINADFFTGKDPTNLIKPGFINPLEISNNLRSLFETYKYKGNLNAGNGLTRLGMNYVISETDLEDDCRKLKRLKEAANENNIFLIVNTNFEGDLIDPSILPELRARAKEISNFGMEHSMCVKGACRLGPSGGFTIDSDKKVYRCPYIDKGGVIIPFNVSEIRKIYKINRRKYANFGCIKRKTRIK